MRLEFRMQRFTKQQHVSLARSVGCVTGCRLVSEQAGDQKNMSCSTSPHIVCKDVRELCQSKYVQVQHVERLLERLIDETSIKPKTGVVHQNVDGQPTRIKPGFQFSAGGGLCKIQSFDDDVDATALPKLLGQFLHRFCATRNIDKVTKQAYRVTDEDVAAAKASGLSEDQIFEIVVCAAIGEAALEHETGVAALRAATKKE